jgi:hypothetical protein
MGFPTTLSMNLVRLTQFNPVIAVNHVRQGMLVGWGILSPLSKHSGWAPGPVGDMATGARGWILWVSLAIMCADSLVSLLPIVYEYFAELLAWYGPAKFSDGGEVREDHEVETAGRLVPMKWVISGLIGSICVGTILVWIVFGNDGIKPWATLIGFLMGGLLSILGYVAALMLQLKLITSLGCGH